MSEGPQQVPQHVAIIMDGNGRWAQKRFMPRTYGHKKGVEATKKAISFFAKSGVRQLTLFAFSSENWNRPEDEVSTLMSLFISSLEKNTDELHANGIRIRFIGDRSAFSQKLVNQIEESENMTLKNKAMTLNIAANYGGQWDILNAVKKLAVKVENSEILAAEISSDLLSAELSLAGSPDPDLFIRTGGEKRISNFLLWQIAYAELFFTDVLWPDFSVEVMQQSLDAFAGRQRRFGKTGEQVKA
ncbi:MAG: di-trans,poly-cis-decaprenylcistransferase [Gammaproteobacteria bacterium]|jgi:undecaprenyl diphosphate synthase|nr:di-trans,poly-cis-decaprenylcistransferase [Gammaproteobacteria bacterium]MBT3723826.1 di-trans,poly-cis-decaprenylcistransferase [Gammaproteobacteria bacterium]MBT4078916.1 di-trans,poly-cis-decaprenylcistransferase [Gammaproteobacteria bacterium]MBT4196380.1 di-trans,poly-cis-decaprenylcistransferase [Gammaproteobacteria bacterium]MBT4448199.1 di-trans,poly-cis-decaprenylcistransferase [Gammaproteobacteria bacterium]